ncbi:hypothetical protein N7447_004007 [Penicillium robsamsonii]|uniref:uncharacterized protein n=1 Tax=Penicillium robsamsonii TaxID=1792511 RepID=UPI00254925C3|nr:uncharacterized protein N7447_004007 [Penicillium robsamsonii]KAJ5827244.1 hypothetical protein N7447_004007 [Penicillium robsamsonii]
MSSGTKNPLSHRSLLENVLNSNLACQSFYRVQSKRDVDQQGVSPGTRASAWADMCCFNGPSA